MTSQAMGGIFFAHLSPPSFSDQQLRQGLPVFWFAAILPLLVIDDRALRPRLTYTVAGVGLNGFDDGELFRPPLSFRHSVILFLPFAANH
jgi:hypothetical protein